MKVSELFDPHAIHNLANPKDKEVTKVDKVEDLASILKTQCSDIIAAYKKAGDPIFRGIKGAKDQVVITQIRQDRRPIEMSSDWHETLHQGFIAAGLKATRKNAIFCTTSASIASDWGTPYVIFPKNGWTVTVFRDFKSDYTFHHLSNLKYSKQMMAAAADDEVGLVAKELEDMGAMNVTTADRLANVISDMYEDILLAGSSYIAVRAYGPMMKKLSPLLDLKI